MSSWAKQKAEYSDVGCRYRLSQSKLDSIWRKIARHRGQHGWQSNPFGSNDEEDFGVINIGGNYAAELKLHLAGLSERTYPDTAGVSIRFKMISDSMGTARCHLRAVYAELAQRVDENDNCWELVDSCNDCDAKSLGQNMSDGLFLALCHQEELSHDFLQDLFVTINIAYFKPRKESEAAGKRREQQEAIYENSKKYGDITMRIVCKELSDLKEPPAKRRRKQKHSDSETAPAAATETTMKTNGVILRSASTVFESMLNTDMKEKQENVIEIHARNEKDVDDMMYCDGDYVHEHT